jgi:hypothetical protein
VAWLWLLLRTPQSAIAQLIGRTPARVSQLTTEIRSALCEAVQPVLRRLEAEIDRPVSTLESLFTQQILEFFPDLLVERFVEQLKTLHVDDPRLYHVGYLLKQRRSDEEIAEQLHLDVAVIRDLVRKLREWRRTTNEFLCSRLAAESKIPREWLQHLIEERLDQGVPLAASA